MDISQYLGGTTFKNIIGIIFITYFIISSSMLLRNFCEGLKVVYYPLTNVIFIIFLFIFGLIISNKLGFNPSIKVTTIILPIVLVSIVLMFFGNIRNFSIEKIYPILGNGFYDTFVKGLINIGTFGGIAYIYFLPPLLKDPQHFKKISLIGIILSGLFILLCVSILLFMFSFYITTDEIMPLFVACKYIEFGTFFQRFESIFLLFWTIAFCCYLSIACKFSTMIFKKICNVQDISILTYMFAFLILAIALIPRNYAISQFFETNLYRILRIGIVFILCISILILSNLKKEKVGDSNQ